MLGVKLSIRPVCGTPQGGVLSSRIWNLAFDPLLKLLNHESPCDPVGFADDGALCFRGIDPETLVDIAQPKINKAVEWGAQNGLTFSVDKTTVVFFSRQQKFHNEVLPRIKKLTINGVEINPSSSMTYLGIVLDQKLSWSPHIEKKVSKAKKFLHLIKPAINHIYGLNPKRMQWIYKQIILPRLTYGCHVWGHSLNNEQITKLGSVERLALAYYAPMWKTTPSASLQIILNKKPSHLEVLSVGIKSYIRCKQLFQGNHWDGIANNRMANSHLKTLKFKSNQISHEGIPLDKFESNFMREPSYNWNPPIRTTLMVVDKNDIDDCFDFDDFTDITNDNNDSFDEADSDTRGLTMSQRMDFRPVSGASPSRLHADENLSLNNPAPPVAEFSQGSVIPQNLLVPTGISKITELTLDQFKNNYRLFAKKLVNVDSDLVIRVILLKNKEVFYNYTFKILGTDNVHDAIIVSTCKVCDLFLDHAIKGDTLLCSLGAGHKSACTSIIRNVHVHNLISTLHRIKDKTGLYIIIEGSKYDWLEYAGGDTIHEDLFVTPNKKVINPTINSYLENQWFKNWENIKGHSQTKFWFSMPDPYLSKCI